MMRSMGRLRLDGPWRLDGSLRLVGRLRRRALTLPGYLASVESDLRPMCRTSTSAERIGLTVAGRAARIRAGRTSGPRDADRPEFVFH